MIVEAHNPRAAGIRALRKFVPLPSGDREAARERKLLRRIDIKEAVRQ